ncbi:hypothetical protein CONLIGDRAFT_627783, partial [Coniochaeta ligniaria NRRL 30616]
MADAAPTPLIFHLCIERLHSTNPPPPIKFPSTNRPRRFNGANSSGQRSGAFSNVYY